jgi:branched-chain amino acid transport system permease protein
MDTVLQQIVNALSLGGVYALLALGLAVVFSVGGLINIAHGELMTIAGYAMLGLVGLGAPWPVVMLGALVSAALAAVAMERVAFRPLRGAGPETLFLSSLVVAVVLQSLFQGLISPQPKGIALPKVLDDTIAIGGVTVGVSSLVTIAVVAVTLAALAWFFRSTDTGLGIRAASLDFDMVRAVGVKADRIIPLAFALSGLLAGVAAVLWIAQRGSVDPLLGITPVLAAFVATAIGGLGNTTGAVLGGFLLGAVSVTFGATLPDSLAPFRDVFTFSVVIVLLGLRPRGLLATSTGERA